MWLDPRPRHSRRAPLLHLSGPLCLQDGTAPYPASSPERKATHTVHARCPARPALQYTVRRAHTAAVCRTHLPPRPTPPPTVSPTPLFSAGRGAAAGGWLFWSHSSAARASGSRACRPTGTQGWGRTGQACAHLRGPLEDAELLGVGQGGVKRKDEHGGAAVREVLCDVSAGLAHGFNLLLPREEHQDVLRSRGLLQKGEHGITRCRREHRLHRTEQRSRGGFPHLSSLWRGTRASPRESALPDSARSCHLS